MAVLHASRSVSLRRLGSLALACATLLSGCAGLTPTGGHASCMDLMLGHALAPGAVSHAHGAGGQRSLQAQALDDPQPSPPPPTPTRAWSDASGWPGGKLPQAGDEVAIPAGQVVLLDVSPPPLAGLTIDGSLVFAELDLILTSDWILVTGGLYVGSAQQGFVHRAEIVLTGAEQPDSGCLGNKHLGVLNGALELYGDSTGASWTRLAATADAGASSIVVEDAAGWRVGDLIVIASTDYFAYAGSDGERFDRQIEERRVAWLSGNEVGLDEPLAFLHFGERQTFGIGTSGFTNTVLESRAEVARLSRNVTVRSEAATADPSSDRHRFGGHIMALGGSRVRLDSVELTNLGQLGVLLRYPVHFHLMGDAGAGSFVRNASLHHLFNRCITVHGTNAVLLDGNAAYDTFGHCYFLEDGVERGNLMTGNLGLMARRPAPGVALLGSDFHHPGPGIFWITNPANDFVGNVAASSEGTGFWYGLPEHPTGPSFAIFDGPNVWPRRTPLGRFEGNLAHSNAADGLHVDRGPTSDLTGVETTSYRPREDPSNPDSEPVTAVFEGFSAYRHRNGAVWTRGDHTVLRNALLVDNAIGATFASNQTWIEDSIVVGESANLGTVLPWEEAGADGRSLPKPWDPDFAIRGFEFYDGEVWADRVHFEGYAPNGVRQAGAIGVHGFTSFSLSPRNHLLEVSFAPGTNEVYLPTLTVADLAPEESDSNADGYRSAAFQDRSGSLTGTAGAWVSVDNALLTHAGCSFLAAWSAHICSGTSYAALTLRDRSASPSGIGPVLLSRGASPGGDLEHTLFGSPHGGPSVPNLHFRSLVPLLAGQHFHYAFTGTASDYLTVDVDPLASGEALLVSLPYWQSEVNVYRDWWIDERSRLPAAASLGGLLAMTSGSAYYLGEGRLWLRLTPQDGREWAHLSVCSAKLCQ